VPALTQALHAALAPDVTLPDVTQAPPLAHSRALLAWALTRAPRALALPPVSPTLASPPVPALLPDAKRPGVKLPDATPLDATLVCSSPPDAPPLPDAPSLLAFPPVSPLALLPGVSPVFLCSCSPPVDDPYASLAFQLDVPWFLAFQQDAQPLPDA